MQLSKGQVQSCVLFLIKSLLSSAEPPLKARREKGELRGKWPLVGGTVVVAPSGICMCFHKVTLNRLVLILSHVYLVLGKKTNKKSQTFFLWE